MKITYLLPITSLALGYYIAEARDYSPPPLPQGDRYVSAQLFGVTDVPAHAVIAAVPSRVSMLGSRVRTATAQVRRRAMDSITVVKTAPRRLERVIPEAGWHPWAEFARMDRAATVVAMSMEQTRRMPEGCPIPRPIYEAIDGLDESAYVKSVIAGAGWVESRWDVNATHYDNDGGNSHGWLQLHGKWRAVDVAWMRAQPGGWRDAEVNLRGFLRTIRDHERYYPQTKGSWKLKLSHYNGGRRGNLSYANKCLRKAEELQRWF